MRQRWHRREDKRKHWYPYFGDYRTRAPDQSTDIVRTWSDDLVESSNHRVSQLGKTKFDLGGGFMVIRREYSEYSTLGNLREFGRVENADPAASPGYGHWTSPQYAYTSSFNNGMFPTVTGSTSDEMDRYGTDAISFVAPTKSEFDLSTAIGELMSDGLPSITGLNDLQSRASHARRAGSAYLNEEFGWAPLVNDVRNLCHTINNASALWNKYAAGSGVLLRRKFKWTPESDTEITYLGRATPAPNFDLTAFKGSGTGPLFVTKHRAQKRWFEGVFMYHVPEGNVLQRGQSAAKHLLGVDLTPELLWNLAPWSWAADWVGNIGNVLSANAALGRDNLVMPWAYVMETTTETHSFELSGIEYKTYPGEKMFRQNFTTTVKQRQRATPYGFGFDLETLTPRQIAILVALGLSKGR